MQVAVPFLTSTCLVTERPRLSEIGQRTQFGKVALQ